MNLLSSSELALSFLIGCTVKATLLLALTAGAGYSLRHRSAAERHHVWALGIAGSLALPLLTLLLPSWHSTALGNAAKLWSPTHAAVQKTAFPTLPSNVVDAVTASPLSSQLSKLALLLWALGSLFVLLKLLGGFARLAWLSARSTSVGGDDWAQMVVGFCKPLGIARPVHLCQCADTASMPLTWGAIRPHILLPSRAIEWSPERRRTVLSHELAHIARHDWLAQIFAELTRALYWFHPLVWYAAARLRSESERACDDSVLNSGVNPSDYANQLLEIARTLKNAHRGWSSALAIARTTNLERRFIAMLDPNLNRCGISRRAGLLAKAAALALLLPLAALQVPGQNLSGKFRGTIFDPSDGAVPNATIVMTSHNANTVDMTTSNAVGNFVFKALPAGEYEMKVLKPGFAAYHAPQLVLEAGRDVSLTVKLNIGGITDNVDVEYRGRHDAFEAQRESSTKAPPSTETAQGPKPTRIRIGGSVEVAKVLTKVQPVYPESAKAAGAQGTVVLHAVVGMDGRPLQLQVLNSQINPDLARAAVEAVSQWRYQPTLLNGEPVEIDTTVTVNFKLLP